jgi:general secretion pathway protein A
MYCNFFGFSEKPFEVTPDPKFLYLSPAHQEILASLLYGINERRGFMVVIGEVGTGKTTLLNAVLDRLSPTTKSAFIFNTDLTFKQMLLLAMMDLGIIKSPRNCTKAEAIHRLNKFVLSQSAHGGNTVFIIDEAQNLNQRSLENLRLLSNLETRKHKLLQIVLSGQPELDARLAQPQLRQLSQRISLRRCAPALTEEAIYAYIAHRLSIANYKGPQLFSDRALNSISSHSGGIPRKINILCDNALLIGYALEKKTINQEILEEVIRDLSWSPFSDAEESWASTLSRKQKKEFIIEMGDGLSISST